MVVFSVRRANKEDIEALAHIHVQGWKAAYGGIVDQDYLDSMNEDYHLEKWKEWIEGDLSSTLMAFDNDNNPAGFVSYGRLRTPPPGMSPIRPLYSGEIYAIYILSDYWRQGLGKLLLQEAAKGLAEMKHKSMCLWVLKKNSRAVGFYKKMGGERCGKKDIEIGPSTHLEIAFGWRDTGDLIAAAV
jgi:ribosomal protein S18 acetylase RimI-like enzyme